jgi:hypothetical protein
MNQEQNKPTPDYTEGGLPVQVFTSRAIPAHEENPVRPRLGRPIRRPIHPTEGSSGSVDSGPPPATGSTPVDGSVEG